MRQPTTEIAELALARLFADTPDDDRHQTLPATLVVRQSCGCLAI